MVKVGGLREGGGFFKEAMPLSYCLNPTHSALPPLKTPTQRLRRALRTSPILKSGCSLSILHRTLQPRQLQPIDAT